jgi:hypothetical protein
MRIMKLRGAIAVAFLPLFFLAEGSFSAEPPKSQTSSAGRVEQVFGQTNIDPIEVGWPPAPSNGVLAQMTVDLESASLLVITFSATASRTNDQRTTAPNIACTIDDTTPCQPGRETQTFLLGNLWDSRSFTWIAPRVGKGKHTLSIGASWAPARPAPNITFLDRTMVVAAAKL